MQQFTVIGGSCHKYDFFIAAKYLSWQKFCCNKNMFVTTKLLSWQAYFCSNKRRFVHNKHVFVVTKLLSRQKSYLWQLLPVIFHPWRSCTFDFQSLASWTLAVASGVVQHAVLVIHWKQLPCIWFVVEMEWRTISCQSAPGLTCLCVN